MINVIMKTWFMEKLCVMEKFCDYFTLRPSDLITIDLRSYGQLLSLFLQRIEKLKYGSKTINICNKKERLPRFNSKLWSSADYFIKLDTK